MTSRSSVPSSGSTPRGGPTRTRTSPWAWLLVVPVLAVLWPPLYNHRDPTLFGVPFFYWYQLAVVPVGVLCTVLVYRKVRP